MNTFLKLRKCLLPALAALGLILFCPDPSGAAVPPERPNVILISVDTMRADAVGCYSGGISDTPNIDRLAEDSVLFENAISVSPWTLPAHMSMFTGLYPSKHRLNLAKSSPLFWLRPKPLTTEVKTLGEIFKSRNYSTAAFTGGGYVDGSWGFNRGFDVYDDKKPKIGDGVTAAIDWLKNRDDRPFFLFLHNYTMHAPYLGHEFLPHELKIVSDEEYAGFVATYHKKNKLKSCVTRNCRLPDDTIAVYRKIYREAARVVDLEFARFLSYLDKSGLKRNTLIIFTSDHGEEFYEHKALLHGHTLYWEQLDIPLIVHLPQNRGAGRRIDALVSNIDIFPTLCEILDAGHTSDGESLFAMLTGTEQLPEKNRMIFSEHTHYLEQKSLTTENYKAIYNTQWYIPLWTWNGNNRRWQFYDRANDPKEIRDLSQSGGQIFDEMRKALIRQMKENKKNRKPRSRGKTASDEEVVKDLRSLGYLQ